MGILRVGSDGGTTDIGIGDWSSDCVDTPAPSCRGYSVGNIGALITNADQGVVYSWQLFNCTATPTSCTSQNELTTVAEDGSTSTASINLPGANTYLQPTLQRADGSYVGTYTTGSGDQTVMTAFTSSGQDLWSQPNDIPRNATADGGVTGLSGTTYDSNGQITGRIVTAIQSWVGDDYQLTSGSVSLATGTYQQPTGSFWAFAGANQSGNSSAKQQVSAVLHLHTGNPWQYASNDDAATYKYSQYFDTTRLGMIISLGPEGPGCFGATEMMGAVEPSSYSGNITLKRTIVGTTMWADDVLVSSEFNTDDTSQPPFRDDDPQSGGSAGKVYDLDAPGFGDLQDSHTWRHRLNFRAWAALPDGTRISPYYDYFVRLSCQQQNSGPAFGIDVSGDNQIGIGRTPLTWNLKSSNSSLGQ